MTDKVYIIARVDYDTFEIAGIFDSDAVARHVLEQRGWKRYKGYESLWYKRGWWSLEIIEFDRGVWFYGE